MSSSLRSLAPPEGAPHGASIGTISQSAAYSPCSTGFSSTPSPWTSTRTVSPGRSQRGGVRPDPTPEGVPVAMQYAQKVRRHQRVTGFGTCCSAIGQIKGIAAVQIDDIAPLDGSCPRFISAGIGHQLGGLGGRAQQQSRNNHPKNNHQREKALEHSVAFHPNLPASAEIAIQFGGIIEYFQMRRHGV